MIGFKNSSNMPCHTYNDNVFIRNKQTTRKTNGRAANA